MLLNEIELLHFPPLSLSLFSLQYHLATIPQTPLIPHHSLQLIASFTLSLLLPICVSLYLFTNAYKYTESIFVGGV